ncbi:uncharacterized protein LOC107781827 isoform X2 [Nicotiana tabacum]|uniref:Uncharacterized protein LOC107781827 isoform X2 n=1 Tax=Nicotiana tabacum TaxID=4097 RepID=A0A1S3Z0U9_TOBAC|nr:uncharacterized protein LOC104095999 isoform X2 [Nicotiana tomentosiformis]XP_016458104.1 PREDICTED: uncharacterized protein LOC107781827 [Nicotiana tabacum]
MRTLCPNLDREDGLETVLEVPIPEEMFASNKHRARQNKNSGVKSHMDKSAASVFGSRNAEIQLLLGVVGAPLIPHPIRCDHSLNTKINDHPIEASVAKYIVQQYIAAAGGEHALNSIDSMYAMGKIKMVASEFIAGDGMGLNNGNVMKIKSVKNGPGEMGGFVLWQKRPDLWSIELVVSGCKISAGSDGKVAWRQTPWHNSHASRGPARPLRRSLQGLDPKSVANLFSNSICVGEKSVNAEDCFVLKLETEPSTLKARSSSNVEVMRHTVWGYFSQRTGLLLQLEDTHLLRIKAPGNDVFWETTMESLILDYRTLDGVNIAHGGRTSVSLFRFGENSEGHTRTRMEEVWTIEEVDFNIKGLSADCFLPPSDLKNEDEVSNDVNKNSRLGFKARTNNAKLRTARKGPSKIMSIDEEDLEDYEADEES